MAQFKDPTKLTRRVFDKYCDRMDLRVARIKEDYRADMKALLARVVLLEECFDHEHPVPNKHECKDPTCKYCSDEDGHTYEVLDSP